MIYLILLTLSILLFVGFFGLTIVEARTGTRILNMQRRSLDKRVGKFFFIMQHVNWNSFAAHIVQSIAARVAHDVAHVTLITVRFAERQLTSVVRTLRNKRPNLLAPKPSRSTALDQVSGYLQSAVRHTREARKKARMAREEDRDRV